MAKKITWWQAAEIIGVSDRSMRRWREAASTAGFRMSATMTSLSSSMMPPRRYYAQLVEEESILTVMAALREVIERKGLFCGLYSDRGSLFWLTPKAGGKVDPHRLTQVERAPKELGIQMIPAYSPPSARAE